MTRYRYEVIATVTGELNADSEQDARRDAVEVAIESIDFGAPVVYDVHIEEVSA